MEAQTQAKQTAIAPPQDVRLMIAIPSRGDWKAATGVCVTRIALQCMTVPLSELRKISNLVVYSETINDLPNARVKIVKVAIERGFTHILWLDADMVVPEDTAHCLLAHNLPLVAANYPTKSAPAFPTAHKIIPSDAPVENQHGEYMVTTAADLGLEPACLFGMGCCLTETALFARLPQPWFERKWHAAAFSGELEHWMGEDKWLCAAALEIGVTPMIDHELSNRVGHIGDFTYLNEHVALGAGA